jgi:hypothetical protein
MANHRGRRTIGRGNIGQPPTVDLDGDDDDEEEDDTGYPSVRCRSLVAWL